MNHIRMCCYRYAVKFCFFSLLVSLLSSCGVRDGAPKMIYEDWDQIPDAVPTAVTPSAYGNPDSYKVLGKTYNVLDKAEGFQQEGIASWYGTKFHGRRTSSGEEYDMFAMTAAHKRLPIPVFVEVTNIDNNRRIIVKVNDRGPFHEGRIIDLSYAAATKLGVTKTGTANVKIRVVQQAGEVEPGVNSSFIDAKGKLFVQVASYGEEKNALELIKKLYEQKFSDVRIHVDNDKGKTLYRVRIGPLPSNDVAKKLIVQLKDNKYERTKIINNL